MRELPEIEVLRRDLEREFAGKRIKSVEATSMRSLPRYRNRKQFTALVEGRKLKGVERRATRLVFNLEGTDALVVDLGDRGLLLRAKTARAARPSETQVVLGFSAGGQVRFVDPGGGEMYVVPFDRIDEEAPELAPGGLDPLDLPVSWQAFGALVTRHDTKLKTLLMSPEFLAGVGTLYSDEILFVAGLRHDRPASSLSSQEVRRLYRGVIEVLQDAVKYRGTTLEADGEDGFLDLAGQPGTYQDHLQVFGREGLPCPRCRKPITKARLGRHTVYFSESQV